MLVWSTAALGASSVLVVSENESAREVAGELNVYFQKQKVKIKLAGPQAPATQCLGRSSSERPRCLSQAGQTAFVDAVLQLGATTAKGRTTVTFQLLSLDEGRLIRREVATGPSGKLGAALKNVVTRLSAAVKPRPAPKPEVEPPTLEKPAPVPVVVTPPPREPPPPPTPVAAAPDAPRKPKLEPVVVQPPPSVVAPVEPSGTGLKVAAWTTTGLAVASAGVAGTFGVFGLNARTQLDAESGGVSSLSRSQANALAAQANRDFTVALGAGIGAGVLGVVSAILWSQTP